MSRTGIRNIITEEIADGNDTANEGDIQVASFDQENYNSIVRKRSGR